MKRTDYGLGRLPPPDWKHVDTYPHRRAALPPAPAVVETTLALSSDLRSYYNQGDTPQCFPAGTRIRLADGSERAIEEARLLDEVVTAEGRRGRVLQTMARYESNGLIKLNVWGHRHLRMTAEHPVLTRRGYVSAGSLGGDDWVAMPRYLSGARTVIRPTDYIEAAAVRNIQTTGVRNYPSIRGGVVEKIIRPLPAEVRLTEGFGRIIGLFLAEGCARTYESLFCFGGHERKTLVADLDALLREELGVEPFIQVRGDSSVIVNVTGKHWALFFKTLCAKGAAGKRLHPHLSSGPPEFLAGVLEGWLSGDGHRRAKRPSSEGVTISRDLALNMFDIAQALGLQPVIAVAEPSMNRHAATRQKRWSVGIQNNVRDHWRAEQDATHVWRRVQSIEHEPGEHWVYNLHVEGDNSYVAEGIGVHNCVGYSQAISLSIYSKNAERFSGKDIWHQAHVLEGVNDPNAGAYVRDGFETVMKRGPLETKPKKKVDPGDGYSAYYWCRSADEVRTALAAGIVVVLGLDWFENFDQPVRFTSGEKWIGLSYDLGNARGGHAICITRWSDRRQAVMLTNSWGKTYPLVWMPASVLDKWLKVDWEAGYGVVRGG